MTDIIAALRSMPDLRHAGDVCGQWDPMFAQRDGKRRLPRIVCIDDDVDFLTVLSRRLEQLGLTVAMETSAVRGFRTVLNERPDLVITDYFMPNEFGTWLLRRMREDATLRELPVIVLTGRDIGARIGRGDATLEQELRRLGAASILTKPIEQQSLAQAMQACLALTAKPDPPSPDPGPAG